MRIVRPGVTYLKPGEISPVFCKCGKVYQPTEVGVWRTVCPDCGRTNIHKKTVKYDPKYKKRVKYYC